MKLATTVRLFAGGPGSGCNPAKGTCGRKSSGRTASKSRLLKLHDDVKYGRGSDAGASQHLQTYSFQQPKLSELASALDAVLWGKVVRIGGVERNAFATDVKAAQKSLELAQERASGGDYSEAVSWQENALQNLHRAIMRLEK